MYVHLNGSLIPQKEAFLPITDLSIMRGYGIFDFLPVINQIPLFFDHYLDRFYASAEKMHLQIPFHRNDFKQHAQNLIQQNGFKDSGLRFVLTGGDSEDGFSPTTPNFFMMNQPYKTPTQEMYENGVKLITVAYVRDLPQIKSLNYIVPIQTLPRWKSENAYDVLYHKNGEISESSRSNFFIIKNHIVYTPNKDILLGITRKKVIESIMELGYEIKEEPVSLEMLKHADEAFITSSTKGLLAVTQVGEQKISNKEGEISFTIRKHFSQKVNAYILDTPL